MSVPTFRYHPDPFATGAFEHSAGTCAVCSREAEVLYVGPFYAVEDVERICPWCIASGRAAADFDGDFIDPHGCEAVDDPAKLDELLHRTPGYFNAQSEQWPSHCGDFCAFEGRAFWSRMAPFESEIRTELERLATDYLMSYDELVAELGAERAFYGYLFRCLVCGIHRVTIDVE